MILSALEINDTGLTLLKSGTDPLVSPGVAVIDEGRLLLGDEAMKQSRLKPGKVNNRFWEQLNLDPLDNGAREVRTAADLAYSHLNSIWQPGAGKQEVILVVPGVYSTEQLGLLLGITNECGIPVTGLVDTAVAGSRFSAPGRRLLHLDVHMHRLVISELEEGQLIRRQHSEIIARVGQAPLTDLWCNSIADAFVRNTRFDPMHQAESEQLLHDRLPAWLASLEKQDSAMLEVESKGRKYQLMIKREQLIQASREMFRQVARQVATRSQDGGSLVQLTHRARALPGLVEALQELDDCKVMVLEAHAGVLGALHHADQIRSGQDSLRFVTSLPWEPREIIDGEKPARTVADTRVKVAEPPATHLVLHGIAQRPSPALAFSQDNGGALLSPADQAGETRPQIRQTAGGLMLSEKDPWLVNGQPAEPGRALKAGDLLQLNDSGTCLTAIRLEPGHG